MTRDKRPNADAHEYHRADLTDAAVAFALQEAASVVKDRLMTETEGLGLLVANRTSDAIRAQIDPTGISALEAYAAKVRAEAWIAGQEYMRKEAAEIMSVGGRHTIRARVDAIRAIPISAKPIAKEENM